jgi:hypothetical protein
MAIIYSYPTKTTPVAADMVLITDSESTNPANQTKQVSIASLTALGTGVSTVSGGTTGITPATATAGAITLAGTLVSANGGTNQSTVTTNDILVGRNNTWVQSSTATGAVQLPAGTTAQAPSEGINGMIRYDSTTNKLMAFINGVWEAIAVLP